MVRLSNLSSVSEVFHYRTFNNWTFVVAPSNGFRLILEVKPVLIWIKLSFNDEPLLRLKLS